MDNGQNDTDRGDLMAKSSRYTAIALIALSVAVFLWVTLALFQFRIINIFDAVLMKFPGPLVIFGAMLVCPLLAAILGVGLIRMRRVHILARLFVVTGALLLVMFIFLIGIPMLINVLKPKTPENPGTPRPVEAQVGLPVFPGAEGFGTRTTAGRGGKVIEVTSLADDGPGTLRAALDSPFPRIVVFRVGGTIEVQGDLFISHPFVTVAGQTAPGGGICIKDAGITIMTHDVLIQHIRVRPGNKGDVDADVNDAISFLGKQSEIDGAYNVVMDHVSASWGEDETVSTWFGAYNITISWSIISEALDESRHRKGHHSAGVLIGDSSYHVSMHHNLLAHNDFRNPLISKGGTHDVVNNVMYNWGVLPAEILDYNSNSFLNFIGNYFLRGPSTEPGRYEMLVEPGPGIPKIYVEGNIGPHRPDPAMPEWAILGFGYGEQEAPEQYRSLAKFKTHPITATSAQEAFEEVLAGAGATLPERDAVDQRVVSDVRNGTGSIINSPDEVGGYPELHEGSAPIDSDHDGMPDDWEITMGLDPGDAADGNGDLDSDGYTNVEEYLHSLLK
jgi:pectate lyase